MLTTAVAGSPDTSPTASQLSAPELGHSRSDDGQDVSERVSHPPSLFGDRLGPSCRRMAGIPSTSGTQQAEEERDEDSEVACRQLALERDAECRVEVSLPAERREGSRSVTRTRRADQDERDEVDPAHIRVDAAANQQRRGVEAAGRIMISTRKAHPGGDGNRHRGRDVPEQLGDIGDRSAR